MIRTLKTASTANLGLAIATVLGYSLYGLSVDLPIDERFLGNGPSYPAGISTPRIPAWTFALMVESVVVVVFIFLHCTERDMKSHRLLCAVVGFVALLGLFVQKLPQLANADLPAAFLQIDQTLAWYVWCSHLVYAVVGPNDD